MPALGGELTFGLNNPSGPFDETHPASFNICYFGTHGSGFTIDLVISATNGTVTPETSSVTTGGFGYGCAPVSFSLAGSPGDAFLTVVASKDGYDGSPSANSEIVTFEVAVGFGAMTVI